MTSSSIGIKFALDQQMNYCINAYFHTHLLTARAVTSPASSDFHNSTASEAKVVYLNGNISKNIALPAEWLYCLIQW